MTRQPVDHQLKLTSIPVRFADGTTTEARAEGNNGAWHCGCETLLVGRCYFQFGDTCFTECPTCRRRYRVIGNDRKRAVEVVEITTASPVAAPAA
jgi:hypothetical protein